MGFDWNKMSKSSCEVGRGAFGLAREIRALVSEWDQTHGIKEAVPRAGTRRLGGSGGQQKRGPRPPSFSNLATFRYESPSPLPRTLTGSPLASPIAPEGLF